MEKNKIILVGVLLVALVSVTAALFYVSTILNRVASSNQNNGNTTYTGMSEMVPMKDITMIGIDDPITTNLISEDEKKHHIIRLTASIGINSKSKEAKKISAQIKEQKVVIRDVIIEILTTKTFEEMTMPNAHQVLKEEILGTLRNDFQTSAIADVYLGEFFIQ